MPEGPALFLHRCHGGFVASIVVALLGASRGVAQSEPKAAPATAPPAPYSLPWQLRPAAVATAVRSDTSLAFYENPASGAGGVTTASMLLVSYKLTPDLAPLVRLGVVGNSPPRDAVFASGAPQASAVAFVNPALGATYLVKLDPDFRLALFLGLTLPIGMGGGDTPDPAVKAARVSGIPARAAMDNAMFAVDDFTVFPGVGVAYVAHGLTLQLEATLLQLFRVRGGTAPATGPASNPDASKTNFTGGLHVGYFLIPQLSLGADLRHQRWLSTPTAVKNDPTDSLRDTTTMAVGARFHAKLSETIWLRPGIAYARGLDDPMNAAGYHIVQLDVPVLF